MGISIFVLVNASDAIQVMLYLNCVRHPPLYLGCSSILELDDTVVWLGIFLKLPLVWS